MHKKMDQFQDRTELIYWKISEFLRSFQNIRQFIFQS